MFEVSTNWLNGAGQVITYSLIISGGLWLLSKIEIKEKEVKRYFAYFRVKGERGERVRECIDA